MYNDALIIHENCNAEDSLKYIEETIEEPKTGTRAMHYESFNQVLQNLKSIRDSNPKLLKLEEILLSSKFDRAIIFSRARDQTGYIVDWINKREKIAHYHAARLTGKGGINRKSGMSHYQQEDVLMEFTSGTYRILACTSVAEEGLDVSKCDLVISYDDVQELRSSIQRKGRARVEDSRYCLITSTENSKAYKEKANLAKESLMKSAVQCLNSMPEDEFLREKKQYQKILETDRKLMNLSLRNNTINNDLKGHVLRCKECDEFACFLDEIRVVQDSHRIVLSIDFRERVCYFF